MEFLDYEGLVALKEELSEDFATKKELQAKDNTSVINPTNTIEKNNDNQVYFLFDTDSGNQDRKIDLYINRDNDFNESHVGVDAYHFMDGLSCPTDGLKGDYADIVARNFIIKNGGKSATIGIDGISVSLDTNDFYTKEGTEIKIDEAVALINRELSKYIKKTELSSVATSGKYSDLSDKPYIPTKVSDLQNDSGFITKDENTTYSLTKQGGTIYLTGSDGVVTSVGDGGSDFNLNNYYTKDEFDNVSSALELRVEQVENDSKIKYYTKEEVDNLIGADISPITNQEIDEIVNGGV